MKLAIMQPYFLPYIGYFQLIKAVDTFVVYDNIEYTKKGWINRNRILLNGKEEYFSIPLKKDSDYLDIDQRIIAEIYDKDSQKILNKIRQAYKKAPCFKEVYPIIEGCFLINNKNLFSFIYSSILKLVLYFDIKTQILISSQLGMNNRLSGENRVISICKHLNASHYINAIGGLSLYNKESFLNNNINLQFINSELITYVQFGNTFTPWLSIIDVMMFNPKAEIIRMLDSYTLI
jgi:hypothetical protein